MIIRVAKDLKIDGFEGPGFDERQVNAFVALLKQNKFKIGEHQKFAAVAEFLKRQLKLKANDSLYLYINSSFAPAPDESISNLFKCFSSENMLVVNYCHSLAWG